MNKTKLQKDLFNIMLMAHDKTKQEFPILEELTSKEFINYYNNFWYPLRNELPKITKPVKLISIAGKLMNDEITKTTYIHLVDYLLCL